MAQAPPMAAVAIYKPGSDNPSLMSNGRGQVLVWDHAEQARHWLPLFGCGRVTTWSADRETAFFHPIDPHGINRVAIVTDYDPFNLPPGMPVLSEAHGRAWKYHQHAGEYAKELGAAAEAEQKKSWKERIRRQFGLKG